MRSADRASIGLAVCLATSGCCQPAYQFDFSLTSADGLFGGPRSEVMWNTRNDWAPFEGRGPNIAKVFFSAGAIEWSSDSFEPLLRFYDARGIEVAVEPRWDRDVPEVNGGCPNDVLTYELTHFPPGEYLMLHRESWAPPGFTSFERDGWTLLDGEPVLQTTLVLY